MEMVDMGIIRFWISGPKSRSVNIFSRRSNFGLFYLFWTILVNGKIAKKQSRILARGWEKTNPNSIPGGASAPPQTPPISRPGGLQIWICILDVISILWICILDVVSRIWIHILDMGNLGTNVANGSVRILTYHIAPAIWVCICLFPKR